MTAHPLLTNMYGFEWEGSTAMCARPGRAMGKLKECI